MQHGTTSSPAHTLGLDLGDRQTSLCLLDANGEVLEEGQIATTKSQYVALFERIPKCLIILEACGSVHWVSRLAEECGHEVVVANPREVHLISRSGRKNDRNDARILARLGRVDPELLRPVKLRGDLCRRSRALLKAREILVRSRAKLVTFTRSEIKSFGERVPACSVESFHKRAKEYVPEPLRESLEPVLNSLEQLCIQIHALDAQVRSVSEERHPETAVLSRIRGVGPILALAFVATVEDPERFSSSRSVGNYVGLAPRLYESGSKSPQLRISKRGDAMLRRLLVNSAAYILGPFGEDSDLRRFGERIARGNSQRDRARARVAVARKLGCILHHLWRTGSVWDPNYSQRDQPATATA